MYGDTVQKRLQLTKHVEALLEAKLEVWTLGGQGWKAYRLSGWGGVILTLARAAARRDTTSLRGSLIALHACFLMGKVPAPKTSNWPTKTLVAGVCVGGFRLVSPPHGNSPVLLQSCYALVLI